MYDTTLVQLRQEEARLVTRLDHLQAVIGHLEALDRPAPTQNQTQRVLGALNGTALSITRIAALADVNPQNTAALLSAAAKRGTVRRVGKGLYEKVV